MIHKIRSWDKTKNLNGKMVYCDELKSLPTETIFINAPREIIQMSFTGKLDVTGKEIYAEDIVKGVMEYGAGMTKRPGKDCLFVVKQVNGEWGYQFFLLQITKLSPDYRTYPQLDHCIVVGNSLENPELTYQG